jgi:hypothetical protein
MEPYTVYERGKERAGSKDPVVYTSLPEGSPAVPTGRVFIRFKDGVKVADRNSDIEDAGYKIAEKIDYAENAAWLSERSGSVAKALAGIEKLESIKGVENVEPQMLMKRAAK